MRPSTVGGPDFPVGPDESRAFSVRSVRFNRPDGASALPVESAGDRVPSVGEVSRLARVRLAFCSG